MDNIPSGTFFETQCRNGVKITEDKTRMTL